MSVSDGGWAILTEPVLDGPSRHMVNMRFVLRLVNISTTPTCVPDVLQLYLRNVAVFLEQWL